MKTAKYGRLGLSKETVRLLDDRSLRGVVGARIKTVNGVCSLNGSVTCDPNFTEVPYYCTADYTVPCTAGCRP